MARTTAEIKREITTAFMNNGVLSFLYGFQIGASFEETFSNTAVESIIFDIMAFCVYTHETLFDIHKAEIDDKLTNQKSGRPSWYRYMALQFQYGFSLVPDKDYFDNTNATEEQIETSKIVKYAAVTQPPGRLVIKIAGESNNALSPIPAAGLVSFIEYVEEIKWGGVDVDVINFLPDRLYLVIQIERDALVLDENGMSILNGNYPVNDAIQEYMKELPFDGQLALAHLTDKLQKVSGVKIPTIVSAQSSWIDADLGGYGPPQPINIKTIPVSGYFEVQGFNDISYVV
ncbi:nucleotidyltransferase [Flavobacterium sp. FlaQc-50]|uniref:nucleotidyltransferase n=1 Tax=unclassified Flavobacterium TaxID=196869 RepID=UPI003756785A